MQWVVYLEPERGEKPFERPFKSFSSRVDALRFSAEQVGGEASRATVWVVDVDDATKAVTAVKMGEGEFCDVKLKVSRPGADRPWTWDELGF
jgi:hypothetical protein